MEKALAFAGETARSIWQQASTLSDSAERGTGEEHLLQGGGLGESGEVWGSKDARVLPDLLTQVSLWVFAELAFSTLRNVQGNYGVP